jgi:hypothetical protein
MKQVGLSIAELRSQHSLQDLTGLHGKTTLNSVGNVGLRLFAGVNSAQTDGKGTVSF